MKAARRPPPSTAARKCGLWEARLFTALSGRRDPRLVPLEGSAKWSGRTGISLQEPGWRVRAAVPNCWERPQEEHWDCKDRTAHAWPRQPLALGRGVLLSTRQTKGKRGPGGLGSGGEELHSLFRVLYVSPALSRATVAFGPLDGQDRYALDHKGINLVTCSREMSTHRRAGIKPLGASHTS